VTNRIHVAPTGLINTPRSFNRAIRMPGMPAKPLAIIGVAMVITQAARTLFQCDHPEAASTPVWRIPPPSRLR
jgi:hypothetical protein